MSIKLANKFLENNKYNEKILRKIDRKSEQYELVPKIKNRRISSIFRSKERKVSQLTIDCITTMIIYFCSFIFVSKWEYFLNFFEPKHSNMINKYDRVGSLTQIVWFIKNSIKSHLWIYRWKGLLLAYLSL